MNPLVSIMIPTYNQPEYILQAVQSALSQDYDNLEIIVSDDSTNNETLLVVEKFKNDERFHYSKNHTNIGRVANYRKLLFKLAKGVWALMLDGDDYIIDTKYISKAIHICNNNPTVVLVGAGINLFYELNNECITSQLIGEDKIFNGKLIFQNKLNLPHHQTDIYPRKLACDLDFYSDPSMASDSESLFRLCLSGDVAYLSSIVAVWRIHARNTTFTLDIKKQIKELVFIDKVHKYAMNYVTPEVAITWREFMYSFMVEHMINLPNITFSNKLSIYIKVNDKLSNQMRRELQVHLLKSAGNIIKTELKKFLMIS